MRKLAVEFDFAFCTLVIAVFFPHLSTLWATSRRRDKMMCKLNTSAVKGRLGLCVPGPSSCSYDLPQAALKGTQILLPKQVTSGEGVATQTHSLSGESCVEVAETIPRRTEISGVQERHGNVAVCQSLVPHRQA